LLHDANLQKIANWEVGFVKKLILGGLSSLRHLPPPHPKQHPLATARATFYDKQPRFGWRGISHRALWQDEQLEFGLAAGARV